MTEAESVTSTGKVLQHRDHLAISKVLESKSACFSDLVKVAGLDPQRSFRWSNLSGVNFDRSDLRGFDFSHSDLSNTKWRGCRYDETTILDGADLSGASGRNFLTRYAYGIRPPGMPALSDIPYVMKAFGTLSAEYLRLVWLTTTLQAEPSDVAKLLNARGGAIYAVWSGQYFLIPLWLKQIRRNHAIHMLVGLHQSNDFAAIAASRIGVQPIRGGSNWLPGGIPRSGGGVSAFHQMAAALQRNESVLMTADAPGWARICAKGVVMLARESGRPVVPVAIATSRFQRLANWDNTTLNLPFSRGAIVVGQLIDIDAYAGEVKMKAWQTKLEAELNRITFRAYQIIGQPEASGGQ